MLVNLHRGNYQTECDSERLGPFEWVHVTYNHTIRVPEDREIATFTDGFWLFDDGTEWTDVTVVAHADA